MASKFSVEETSTTPAAAEEKLMSKDNAPRTEAETEEMRITPYREAVGALAWAATMTRPDVAYAARQLGKFNDNPGPVHWRAAKRSAFGFRRSSYTVGGCNQLVLEGAEGDRGRVIRINVCGASRSCT